LVSTAFASNLLRQKLAGKSSPEEKDAGEIAKLLDEAITQARSLARGLYPVKLEAEGLASALEELASNVTERFGIDCVLNCPDTVFISDNAIATHLYRIVQEAVTNAVKHSKANRIVIGVTAAGHEIAIKVADDGVGIREPFGSRAGMGLHIMQYRARMIGGRLKVGRGENGGSIILCSVEQKSIE
jgi:signal transduction histidine kinase